MKKHGSTKTRRSALFRSRGFYLHTSWNYEYPFAVRKWARDDFHGMFRLLKFLDMDKVMIWPLVEVAPPPLAEPDAEHYRELSGIVTDAKETGLECWLTFTPNLTTKEAIRSVPIKDRVFYPSMRMFRFDQPGELNEYLAHMRNLLLCLDNADAYVLIDGDPGGYPGAKPPDYLAMLDGIRKILDESRTGKKPKLVHWVWCGWGADWAKDGCWKSDLKSLVGGMLDEMKTNPPAEPWELLPGRHLTEKRGNGRQVLELVDRASLMDRSTLMLYEIIECEPSPPAFVNQFEDIRRVIRQEMKYARQARGVFGNAQQPIVVLQNLFYFAKCTGDAIWLDKSDDEVFAAYAEFLGGDTRVLAPALNCAMPGHDALAPDLDLRVRELDLQSEAAECIPGGPTLYLDILAEFVRAHIDIAESVSCPAANAADAMARLTKAVSAAVRWWNRHRYVFSGEVGNEFRCRHVHWQLIKPLKEWLKNEHHRFDRKAKEDLAQHLAGSGPMSRHAAEQAVSVLMEK